MIVKFNVVSRGKPGDKVTSKKVYLSIVATGKVDQQQVAKMAADVSTVSSADAAAVIENFLSGNFGSFWLRIETDVLPRFFAVETPKSLLFPIKCV